MVSHKWLGTKNTLPHATEVMQDKGVAKAAGSERKNIGNLPCWLEWSQKKCKKREQPGSTWIDVSKYLGSEYMLTQFPRLGDNDRFEVSGLPAESYQDWGKINEHARLQFPNARAPPRASSNPPASVSV